jgi:SSS family solute:Na+ symporter
MNFERIDWIILIITLLVVIGYGLYRSNAGKNMEGYFLSDRQLPWWLVLLSIMGTQASAITFLTAPGQAYTDGMRFIQYYFGLPLAMIVICIFFLPYFHKLKLYTAYEFLEQRFDLRTRSLTSFLFLLSRGLSTGISIFAPSLVLHSMLGWDIYWTNIFMGGLLIIYTISGGAKAVAYTQQLQFIIIYSAMFLAGYYAIQSLPDDISFYNTLHIAGKTGKLNIITDGMGENGFDWKDKYNIWSGLIGGFFLALSYFGTDQSQVGRYLTSKNIKESRWSLLMNGIVKVPLQFLILLIGILVYVYYVFFSGPVFFNHKTEQEILKTTYAADYRKLNNDFNAVQNEKKGVALLLSEATEKDHTKDISLYRKQLQELDKRSAGIRKEVKSLISLAVPGSDTNDTNYIFLRFVGDTLPNGLIGLIIAIVFLSAWGSIAAALHSLASSTMIDFHKRFNWTKSDMQADYKWSRFYTLAWGIFCVLVAQFAYGLGNSLIEAVNILGSLFYGTILGIFLVALVIHYVKGKAVFYGALAAEAIILLIFYMDIISFLWLNVIGAGCVILFSCCLQMGINYRKGNA